MSSRLITSVHVGALAAAFAVASLAGCGSHPPDPPWTSCGEPSGHGASAEPLYVYLSPDGSDENPGSEAAPVATLQRAQEILSAAAPTADAVIRIRSDRGPYEGQSVIWEYWNAEYNTTLEAYPDSIYAVFRQGGAGAPFFELRAASGRPTNLHFKKLSIEGYASGAISFLGSAGDEPAWNGSNSIVDCIFRDIGNASRPERRPAWAVIDLVNSRRNLIEDCAFIDCANANTGDFPQDTIPPDSTSGGPLPILGIYIAHHSGCNCIAGCTFERIKGDAVRLRDDSNDNEIRHSYFARAGWTAICTAWYAHPVQPLGAASECPSWHNTFHDNLARGNWLCGEPRLYYDMSSNPRWGCPEPPGRYMYQMKMWSNESGRCVE
jgi:hypothetical protein